MILQVAKRIANIRFNRTAETQINILQSEICTVRDIEWTFICVREYVVKTEMECLSHKKKGRL